MRVEGCRCGCKATALQADTASAPLPPRESAAARQGVLVPPPPKAATTTKATGATCSQVSLRIGTDCHYYDSVYRYYLVAPHVGATQYLEAWRFMGTSRVISRITILITHTRGLVTLL